MLPKKEVHDAAHELKVIIYNNSDFKFAEEQAAKVNGDCMLFMQPEWSKKDKMIPLMVDYVMKNPKWKMSLQTHKYMNIP
jgi:organic radical activating enzyme